MKRALIALGMILMAAPAHADISHKLSTSVQLTVDAAASQATRIGSTYSVSGSNITPATVGGLGSLTSGTAVGYTPTAYGLTTDGSAYTFTESFIEGDDVPSGTTVSSGVLGPFLHMELSPRLPAAWLGLSLVLSILLARCR